MSYDRFVVPYAVEEVNRKGSSFTVDMEVAAIVCLAEAQRKKKGFSSSSSEKVSFVSKMHYPLWAVPWEDKCLIVDGLASSSYKDEYSVPPDVKLFVEDLKRSSSVREESRKSVKRHTETFTDFAATVDIPLNAVIADRNLLTALLEQSKQGTPPNENTEPITAPLELNREGALETCRKFVQHWRQVRADIKGFQYALNVLEEETNLQERGILCEIEQLREKYANGISSLRSDVEKRIKNLTKKQESEVAKVTKAAGKKLRTVTKDKEKYERKLQTLERSLASLREKVKASKRKGDKSRVARWSYEVKRCRGEIDRIKTEIKALSVPIESKRKESKDAIEQIEERYRKMIEQEEVKIVELMALRDSEIAGRRRELNELLSGSSHIRKLIEQLVERKKLHASKLREETTIPWERDEVTLIYVPFYLVGYEKDTEARYGVYPPILARGYRGFLRTVQKAIRRFSLESRINLLLRPRSKDLSELLSSALVGKMREDKAFVRKMLEVCRSSSLLNSTNIREALTNGIGGLRKEGWVKLGETHRILSKYGGI